MNKAALIESILKNLEGNKKRMTTIPFGVDPIPFLADWFRTDEGVEVFRSIEKRLN